MNMWKNFLVLGFLLIFGFLILNLIPKETTSPLLQGLIGLLHRSSIKTTELLTDAADELIPIVFATLFGGLGSLLRAYVLNFDESLESETKIDIKQLLNKQVLISSDFLHLGMIMGVVGYLVVQSKFVVKLFYSGDLPPETKIHFLGIAIAGILFGYFSLEIAGSSRRIVSTKLNQAEKIAQTIKRDQP